VSAGASEVGPLRPIEDFKEMISRRDIDLVDKGIETSINSIGTNHSHKRSMV
jgi:hypothetical protein